jgi:hypothetical protein
LVHVVTVERGMRLPPLVFVHGLQDHLGAGGAREMLRDLLRSRAVVVDTDGVKLTSLGEGIRAEAEGLFGLLEAVCGPANDVYPREGNA